ncbi:MAG: hypothetical protein NVS4B8_17730 [Herpetosiphon sp.]
MVRKPHQSAFNIEQPSPPTPRRITPDCGGVPYGSAADHIGTDTPTLTSC